MRPLLALLALGLVVLAEPAFAQSNDDDYTPLNSRIRRDRQFPTDLPPRFTDQLDKVSRERSKDMQAQFSKCLFRRSNEKSLDLLARTDFGFADFQQVGLDNDKALRIYGFSDCLGRVAATQHSGVALRFTAGALRQWLLQEAYVSRYPKGPTWIVPGATTGEREYPLSREIGSVHMLMDFADCVVQTDPYSADFLFRSRSDSEEERAAIDALTPSLGPCLPEGQQISLSAGLLRTLTGEALWYASSQIDVRDDEEEW